MPRMDTTGPMGQGPMTGRGMGCCGGQTGVRRFGCRGGWGVGGRFFSAKNELSALQEEEKFLKDELSAVQAEIKETETQK